MVYFGLVFAAAVLFGGVMALYLIIYKRNINKAVTEKNTTHIRMVPPYKIAILLSVIVLLVIVYLFSAIHTSYGSVGVTSLPLKEYLQEADTPEINEWLANKTKDDNKAYILKSKANPDNTEVRYLVYVPYAADNSKISVQRSSNLFGETVTLNFEAAEGNRGDTAVFVTYAGGNRLNIKINYGGRNMESIISEIDCSIDIE